MDQHFWIFVNTAITHAFVCIVCIFKIVPTNQTAEADYSAYSAMEESLDQGVPHEGEDENLLTEVQPEPTEF